MDNAANRMTHKNLRFLRLKIAALVTGAILCMSLVALSAAISFSSPANKTAVIAFRYLQGDVQIEAAPQEQSTTERYQALTLPVTLLIVIVGGSLGVGATVSNLVVRPLYSLQSAVESVNPHGLIPQMKESKNNEDLGVSKLINSLSTKLQRAMESRMRLVAAAGHDLRTPITRMKLRAEFIEDDEMRAQWMKDIDEMTEIANSAIQLVQEEISDHKNEIIDLDIIVSDICHELSEIGLNVIQGKCEALTVNGGHHSIKRAVSNLLSNAAIYGDEATITLTQIEGMAVVTITDIGPGIPEDMIELAFEPFFRAAPAREKKKEGVGLGLAIAKEIVDRHHGEISLTNTKRGLRQVIRLPMASHV